MSSQPTDSAPAPAVARRPTLFDLLSRRLYNHNPFYVLSAAFVFWGLRLSFATPSGALPGWELAVGLAGYTMLLGATAVLIVRCGRVKVWDDARSLLVVIVLALVALSVVADDALVLYRNRGIWLSAAGLIFAITLSEGVLRGMRIALPWGYRLPYYLALALFFVYPVVVSRWAAARPNGELEAALLGFPLAAAVVALAFLPAVRRGAAYVQASGTPWTWPWYPMSAIVFLALAVAARSYYLCLAFQFVGHDATIFAPYFLVPFLFTVNLVWLEGAVASRNAPWRNAAMVAPLLVLLVACIEPADALALDFRNRLAAATGAQSLFWAVALTIAFYAIAAARRLRWADEVLAASVAILVVVHRDTAAWPSLYDVSGWPLWIVAAQQAILGLWRRHVSRIGLAVCLALVATTLECHGTWFTAYAAFVPLHLTLAVLLITGLATPDALGRWLRRLAVAALLCQGIATLARDPLLLHLWPEPLVIAYPWLAGVVLVIAAEFVGESLGTICTVLFVCACCVIDGSRGYGWLRPRFAGLDQLAAGVTCFALGLLISVRKAGWRRRPRAPSPDLRG